MFPMPDLGGGLFHQPNTTSETMHSDSDLQSDIFTPATTIVAEKTSKFHPKPCINNKKNLPMPSKSRASEGPSSTSKFHDPAYNRWPVEGSSGPSLGFPCPDLSSPSHHVDQDPKGKAEYSFSTNVLDELPQSVAGESKERTDMYCLESLDGDVKSSSASGAVGPASISNLYSISSEPISVLSELEVSHSPLVTKAFVANVEAFHLSERDADLQIDSVEIGKVPTAVHSNVEPLDDLLMQSDSPVVEQIGKCRPKPALCMKQGKRAKSVSFILPNNEGESAAFVKCQSELVTSSPIMRITSFVKMMSDQNMDDSLGSLSTCNRDNQINLVDLGREDVTGISALDTLDIHSESVCNSDKHAEKFQSELQAITKSARTDAEYSQLDSLPIHNESLDAHDPSFPVGDLSESLTIKAHSCFAVNSCEVRACCGNINDLEAPSLAENEDLRAMEGEHTIDHIEEPNLEECVPSIVQNDKAGKSSRKVRQRNKKLKASVDNMAITDQNAKNTISEVDDDYGGEGYKDDDLLKKKKSKLPRKSSSKSSEHENSIKCSKKVSKDPGSTVKDPPKKRLLHGTRRCKSAKRQVNKALLEIPDDELDRRQLVIRDLIRLAGFKEQISNKEKDALKNSFANQSEEHKQNPNSDDANEGIQKVGSRLNYHSYMSRPRQTRWSKADTEFFYQAIRQFGTDFAMIQILFPNRSRQQVKAKFKNEQRKHPLEMADALVHRCKDHSHFEKVIEHLQAVAEQNSKNDASDPTAQSQDEADQNELQEVSIEANSKEEQDVNYFGSDVECSLKSTEWDGNDFDQHSEASSDTEKFWI